MDGRKCWDRLERSQCSRDCRSRREVRANRLSVGVPGLNRGGICAGRHGYLPVGSPPTSLSPDARANPSPVHPFNAHPFVWGLVSGFQLSGYRRVTPLRHGLGGGFGRPSGGRDAGGERTGKYSQRVGEGLPQPMHTVVLSTTAQTSIRHHSTSRLPSP